MKYRFDQVRYYTKCEIIDYHNLGSFIKECILNGGVPLVKTRFAGTRLDLDGDPNTYEIMVVCWAGPPEIPCAWAVNVPEEDWIRYDKERRDYAYYIDKYMPEFKDLITRARANLIKGIFGPYARYWVGE